MKAQRSEPVFIHEVDLISGNKIYFNLHSIEQFDGDSETTTILSGGEPYVQFAIPRKKFINILGEIGVIVLDKDNRVQ